MFNIFKKKPDFPFKESMDTAVFSCKCVMREDKEISYVSHEVNGDWHFFCSDCGKQIGLDKIMIIALEDIAKKHIDIVDFANLEQGKCAIKNNINNNFEEYDIYNNDYHRWLDDIKNKITEVNKSRNNNVLRSDYSGVRIKR